MQYLGLESREKGHSVKITYLNTSKIWKKYTPKWRRAGNENMNLFESSLISNEYVNNYMLDVKMFQKSPSGIWPVKLKNEYIDSISVRGDVLFASALSPDMVYIAFKSIKHDINQKRALWLIDGWKKYWQEWLSLIHEYRIDFVFCAYLENTYWLKQENIRCSWLPFAIEPSINSFSDTKLYDVVQMGRIRKDYDNVLRASNIVYKTNSSFRRWFFFKKNLKYKDYCHVLSLSYFTLCYPSGYELDEKERKDILGFVPTNMRWYEAMAAKSLPIGEIPTDQEFRLLFPNDKTHIIEANPENIISSIKKLSASELKMMLEKNYRFIIENHTYQARVKYCIIELKEFIQDEK